MSSLVISNGLSNACLPSDDGRVVYNPKVHTKVRRRPTRCRIGHKQLTVSQGEDLPKRKNEQLQHPSGDLPKRRNEQQQQPGVDLLKRKNEHLQHTSGDLPKRKNELPQQPDVDLPKRKHEQPQQLGVDLLRRKKEQQQQDANDDRREVHPDIFDILNGKVALPEQEPPPQVTPGEHSRTHRPSASVVYLPEKPQGPVLRIEDTFWSEKKRVLPDLRAVKAIEDHALTAPANVMTSPERLAAYLVKPCKTEIEKLRAIYWWLTHNIRYDVTLLNEGFCHGNTLAEALRTGTAICSRYAGLCVSMLRHVGLEAETLTGTAKGAGYWPGELQLSDSKNAHAHAWNKVKVDGTWFLMDATWSAGAVNRDAAPGKQEFEFKWDETYFLAEPVGFLNSHLPLESNLNPSDPNSASVITDQQLVQSPLNSYKEWDNIPSQSPICSTLGITSVNHPKGIIHTEDNEVNILLKSAIPVDLWVVFKQRTKKHITAYHGYTWISNNGKEIEVYARLPSSGIYHLEIYGQPWKLEEQPNDHQDEWVKIVYTIVGQGRKKHHNILPVGTKSLGPTLQFLDAGFHVIQPSTYVMTTKNARANVVIEMPADKHYVPLWAALQREHMAINQSHLLLERKGNLCIVHVICPEKGEYRLDINTLKETGSGYTAASFIINCDEDCQDNIIYPDWCHELMGPKESFYKHGMQLLYPKSSTVYAHQGNCILIVRYDHPIKSWSTLTDSNGKCCNTCLKEEKAGDIIRYNIRLATPGIFRLGICISPETTETAYAAFFLVIYPKC